MSNPFEQFKEDWLPRLRNHARLAYKQGQLEVATGTHCDVADGIVTMLGLKPIGFNWELLDAGGAMESPRSALGEITAALSNDISNPSRAWLPSEEAETCARSFLALFDQAMLTIVSNRYDGLWNPISGAASEWGFVAYDAEHFALFLIAEA